ncbi:ribbon-helix-helix domain-containing protein [Nodularia chucula]|uniref:ribbon-helix-helix domain-containing protein n=1 Tax=Nodularia chucula TaxID=3093667 RepID=UPI0039C6D29C
MTLDRYKGKRHTVTFPENMYQTIQKMSQEDNRTVSQMIVQLCSEAIKHRSQNEQVDQG